MCIIISCFIIQATFILQLTWRSGQDVTRDGTGWDGRDEQKPWRSRLSIGKRLL